MKPPTKCWDCFGKNWKTSKSHASAKTYSIYFFKIGFVLLYFMTIGDMVSQVCYIWSNLFENYSPVNQHNQELICWVYMFLRGSCLNISAIATTLMSVERLVAAYFPIRYKNTVTVPLISKLGIGCVIVSLLHSLISTVFYGNDGGLCLSVESDANPTLFFAFVATTSILFILMPTVITAMLNIFLILKIRRRNSRFVLQFFSITSSKEMKNPARKTPNGSHRNWTDVKDIRLTA